MVLSGPKSLGNNWGVENNIMTHFTVKFSDADFGIDLIGGRGFATLDAAMEFIRDVVDLYPSAAEEWEILVQGE